MTEFAMTSAEQEAFFAEITRTTGLVFSPQRRECVLTAIRPLMKYAGTDTLPAFQAELITRPRLMELLMAELTVGETYFFREPDQFAFLEGEVIPRLLREQGPRAMLNFWSAGCSTGEEAYSLAMLFEQAGVREEALILGSDISHVALDRARQAVYREWSFRGAARNRALRHTTPVENGHRLLETITRRVDFRYLNLATSFGYGGVPPQDVILCRNVLIYFNEQTIREVVSRLLSCLTPDGYLLTAATDPPLQHYADLKTEFKSWGTVYRLPQARSNELSPQPAPLRPPAPVDLTDCGCYPRLEQLDQWLHQGDFQRVVQRTGDCQELPILLMRIKALTKTRPAEALPLCLELVRQLPLDLELRFTLALLQSHLDQRNEAIQSLRQVIYLDSSIVFPHFTLGTLLLAAGKPAEARRCFRNVTQLCQPLPPTDVLPLSEGATVQSVCRAAARYLQQPGEIQPSSL